MRFTPTLENYAREMGVKNKSRDREIAAFFVDTSIDRRLTLRKTGEL